MKRWYLWEWWDSADDRVYDFSDELAKYKAKRCTEVRLVPVDAKPDPGESLKLTKEERLCVELYRKLTPDPERWEDATVLYMRDMYQAIIDRLCPPEKTLKCPACGHPAGTHEYAGKWTVSCSRCQLRFGTGSAYPFATESEAREAFRRMGGGR